MCAAFEQKWPRIAGLLSERFLAKRGAHDEARTLATAFIAAFERTDVPVPAVAEMQAPPPPR